MTGNKVSMMMFVLLTLSILSGCVGPAGATPRGDEISLPGTTWALVQLNGDDVTGEITLQFDEEQVSGIASCNNYFGQYTLEGEKITLGPVGSTMMACLEMEDEAAYLKALSEVKELRFENEQLILLDGEGKGNLVFQAMQHASLAGTKWTLTGWNTGTAISSVVIDTEISLEMRDGQVSGTAGCNHYFADYEAIDASLKFGVIASTEMYCMDPEGVMEQEVGYLEALRQIDSFEIYGDMLTLSDEQGTRMLTFVRAE